MTARNPGLPAVTRRQAIKAFAMGLGAAVGAPVMSEAAWTQALAVRQQAASAPAGLKFFSAAQMLAVDALSERIIPADARSPGASAARVAEFIDLLLSGASDIEQNIWIDGLTALDAATRSRWGSPFAACTADEQIALLMEASQQEPNPQTPVEKLFVAVKERTIQGYYTSEIGIHQELGYTGNQFLNAFVGCTHPEHMG